jgi:glutamate-5-semialdehyde dehydrogenase
MTTTSKDILKAKGKEARASSRQLAKLGTAAKNRTLLNLADRLLAEQETILLTNRADCDEAKGNGLSAAGLDRLLLTPERLEAMARDVRSVASLPDPVGEMIDARVLPNGLSLGKRRVPLGVIGAIYESRPNVTIDIFTLSFKSGNACILRGGHEALRSNKALVEVVWRALEESDVPRGVLQFVEDPDRALVESMLEMREYIDLLVPRGGADLIRYVGENASMAVVTGGVGVCHTYVDKSANLDMASAISYNAKVQRPTVCNAMDTLLVHSEVAPSWLPRIASEWGQAGVQMRCDRRALSILAPSGNEAVQEATDEDWGKEHLALVASVRIVDSLDDALDHIELYGSGHSEAIVTEDYTAAMRFLDEVDAAAVFVNASTRFTDGAEFGLGAEVGISTQKFHARGPMGLRELTTYKWVVMGTGQVRP